MAELILVKAADPERVALWERNEDHPDQEVFVWGEQVFQVANTAQVQQRLASGALVLVEDAPTEETPATEETPEDAPTEETPAPKTKKAKA